MSQSKALQEVVGLGLGVDLELVRIPAGSFVMGSNKGEGDERPLHLVTIPRPFRLGKHQVTQRQWQAVMGSNRSHFKRPDCPVESVSLYECRGFLKKLSEMTGRNFTLPSEAEWEYACRAGSITEFCFGDDESGLDEFGWYYANSGGKPHPVGQKRPNAWGLYDMHGNVSEWCEDAGHDSYAGAPTDGSVWKPEGRSAQRILRGGSYGLPAKYCRSAYRTACSSKYRWSSTGCRVCLQVL